MKNEKWKMENGKGKSRRALNSRTPFLDLV
jgi:hypothetical protein